MISSKATYKSFKKSTICKVKQWRDLEQFMANDKRKILHDDFSIEKGNKQLKTLQSKSHG